MVKKSIIQDMSAVLWYKLGKEMRMNSPLDNFKRLIKNILNFIHFSLLVFNVGRISFVVFT